MKTIIISLLLLSSTVFAEANYEIRMKAGQKPVLVGETAIYCEGAAPAQAVPTCRIQKSYRTGSSAGSVTLEMNGRSVRSFRPSWNSSSSFADAEKSAEQMCQSLADRGECECKY